MQRQNTTIHYSLITPDVTAVMLLERTRAKKSFGNLTLLLMDIGLSGEQFREQSSEYLDFRARLLPELYDTKCYSDISCLQTLTSHFF